MKGAEAGGVKGEREREKEGREGRGEGSGQHTIKLGWGGTECIPQS